MPLDLAVSEFTADKPKSRLRESLFKTRHLSLEIAAPLTPEDMVVQASEDASPAKWHLAHTAWFFEELVLKPYLPGYREFDERFSYCFNSYYESLGARHPRAKRGLLTRPTAPEVVDYRAHVDEHLDRVLDRDLPAGALGIIEIGINHEQQHQELMLTDILALFDAGPLKPVYREFTGTPVFPGTATGGWTAIMGGLREIGHSGKDFAYDNEGPRHKVYLRDFQLANHAVTNREWLAFMNDGGYETAALWLTDGWAHVQREGWQAPGYFERVDGEWRQMTLHGLRALDLDRPVCHVSYYEANAYARWAGHRLPTEFEWEVASAAIAEPRETLDLGHLSPKPASGAGFASLFGGVWEWTQSAYLPYPGYKTVAGPLGEYNGKFMCNQFVLRGGSCATPDGHIRRTYRNFFYPHQRWQFMGLRLASDV